jgi:hypothetical protein
MVIDAFNSSIWLRKEALKFKVSLGYIARSCLKNKQRTTTIKTSHRQGENICNLHVIKVLYPKHIKNSQNSIKRKKFRQIWAKIFN